MEIPGDEGRREEEDNIEDGTGNDIEPEHGIVVVCRWIFDIREPLGETAALQIAGNESEDGEHAHHAVVARRELLGKHDAEHEVKHLYRTTVYRSPKEPLGCLLLQ